MAISKGLTGGYMPLAATLTTEAVYREFLGRYEDFKTFFHGHSYTGNPLGCAVALANLAVFKRERTLEKLLPRIEALRTLLRPLQEHSHVGDIRQIGLIAGIELVRDRVTKEPYSLMDRMGARVTDEARATGLLLRPLGNIIVLMPPLSTTIKELRMMVHVLAKAIETATGGRLRPLGPGAQNRPHDQKSHKMIAVVDEK
jgi:adenosylmethionine-8-amino-7-oxononanoate aminotransferase